MVDEVRAVLTIVTLFPDLLGTYGDGGNGLVLAERARRRGVDVHLTTMELGEELPEAQVYLLGGGEDGPQRLARDLLAKSSFARRVADGATVVAICAGLQILGQTFSVQGDDEFEGLAVVDVRTRRGRSRSVGELYVEVGERGLVGFENHGGETVLGEGVQPLGRVRRGRGNDGVVDGYRTGSIWASYAHGPVLALNPWLADEILESVLGHSLEPLTGVANRLHAERCATLSPR